MRSTEAVITEMIEAYGDRTGQWIRIGDMAQDRFLTPEEVARAIAELIEDDDFRAEPEPFSHRITEADRAYAPVIGGEARHLIAWF